MQYCEYGSTGMRVSRFGLGAMRFPDDQSAMDMVRYAFEHGVNYFDSAYLYADSERRLGMGLRGLPREEICIATKSPTWLIESQSDFERYLDEELQRLQTSYIDVYLLHNLYDNNWKKIQQFEPFDFLARMKEKGKIRHTGFSIHGTAAAFRNVVDAWDGWDMAQIQLNVLDEHHQVGVEGLAYGSDKGLAMVIMEPLRGGRMIEFAPPAVSDILARYPKQRPLVEWLFRWLYDKPEVNVVLSGTTTVEQLAQDIAIFNNSAPGTMNDDEHQLIAQIRQAYEAQQIIGCTGCEYCLPCPEGVSIPKIFKLYNNYRASNRHISDRMYYTESFMLHDGGADRCIACATCEGKCPQFLPIAKLLAEVQADLGVPMKHFGKPINSD